MQGIDKYRRLYKAIGYTFTNEALLEQALLIAVRLNSTMSD